MIHCGLHTKGAKPSQEDLHEKVVIGGVFHLILLVLVFDSDCRTHACAGDVCYRGAWLSQGATY